MFFFEKKEPKNFYNLASLYPEMTVKGEIGSPQTGNDPPEELHLSVSP
jgi:hypothetical protein